MTIRRVDTWIGTGLRYGDDADYTYAGELSFKPVQESTKREHKRRNMYKERGKDNT